MNHYSVSELVKTGYSYVLTKLFYANARLIRRPIYIRDKKSMSGCRGLTTGRFCRFDLIGNKSTLYIGDNCEFGDMTHIVAYENVSIGNNVLIASKCFISDTNHGDVKSLDVEQLNTPPNKRFLVTIPTQIGDNVWIGENSVILPGSKIGNGCIVGANSVISKDIPPYSVVVGNNRIIKHVQS